MGSDLLWKKVKASLQGKQGLEDRQWLAQYDQRATRELIDRLVAHEKDRRVQVWIRVRLGGEKMLAVARDLGYRDGSGVAHVVKRLERAAQQDRHLRKRLAKLAQQANMS